MNLSSKTLKSIGLISFIAGFGIAFPAYKSNSNILRTIGIILLGLGAALAIFSKRKREQE